MPLTGGHVATPPGTNEKLTATAVSETESVLQIGDETIVAPFDKIDTNKVEVACNDEGCALVLKDGILDNSYYLLKSDIYGHILDDGNY